MKLIVIATVCGTELSEELECARSQMMALLPHGIPVRHVIAPTFAALLAASRGEAEALDLAAGDHVLLLRSPFLYWAPGTLQYLQACLLSGEDMAFGYDSIDACPEHPPSYLTIRGLERYAASLAVEARRVVVAAEHFPAMVLGRVDSLREDHWRRGAARLSRVFAHDFSGYHQGRREEVLPLVPPSATTVLDVGGGEGGFLKALKETRQCETHLAEYSPAAYQHAMGQVDRIWPGDFLTTVFDRKFDCVTFLDVLEHAVHPLAWLKKAAPLLTPNGCIVASIPNVGHWSVVADLIEGRWDYAAAGIHCVTHLRFFSRSGIERLFADAGLEIVEFRPTRIEVPVWFDCSALMPDLRVDRDSLATYAFHMVAKQSS